MTRYCTGHFFSHKQLKRNSSTVVSPLGEDRHLEHDILCCGQRTGLCLRHHSIPNTLPPELPSSAQWCYLWGIAFLWASKPQFIGDRAMAPRKGLEDQDDYQLSRMLSLNFSQLKFVCSLLPRDRNQIADICVHVSKITVPLTQKLQ